MKTSATGKSGRKSQVLPNQSMTIEDIVNRYVRGAEVHVQKREGVYLDQKEHDFEKMSRADFGEQHELAQQFAGRASGIAREIERSQDEQRTKDEDEENKGEQKSKKRKTKPGKEGTGIGDLDNTMPVDTESEDQ